MAGFQCMSLETRVQFLVSDPENRVIRMIRIF